MAGLFLAGGLAGATPATNEQVTIERAHNYPNPFDNRTEVTKIKFYVSADKAYNNADVSVVVYDFNGRKAWTKRLVINIPVGNTPFEVLWGGDNDMGKKVASGLYYGKIVLEGPNTKFKVIKILVK
jgi:flagellar hook assembly protein FlgD